MDTKSKSKGIGLLKALGKTVLGASAVVAITLIIYYGWILFTTVLYYGWQLTPYAASVKDKEGALIDTIALGIILILGYYGLKIAYHLGEGIIEFFTPMDKDRHDR